MRSIVLARYLLRLLVGFSCAELSSIYYLPGRQNMFEPLQGRSLRHRNMAPGKPLPKAMPYIDRYLLRVIQQEGVAESHLDALRFDGTSALLKAAAGLVETLPPLLQAPLPQAKSLHPTPTPVGVVVEPDEYQAVEPSVEQTAEQAAKPAVEGVNNFAEHCVHADSARIVQQFPEILYWGLSDRILDLVEAYLGCPPALIGAALRKDNPNGQQSGTRLWHLDGEDQQVFKIFVYLNDVGPENGPFEYVPKSCFNPAYRRFSLKHRRFWRDPCRNQDLAQIVPSEQWRAATGPAGTILLSDTASVFHHGAIAHQGERLMLIFAYTSRQPLDVPLAAQFFPAASQLPVLVPHLSERQRQCLFAWRGWEVNPSGTNLETLAT